MKRPRAARTALAKLSKAVRLPNHPLSRRLGRLLGAVDAVLAPKNLKQVTVFMNPFVPGAAFDAYTGTGPYTIDLNPGGAHPELSLVHELGHFLEWQAIPKAFVGHRNFNSDKVFDDWLNAALSSPPVQRLVSLRDQQDEGTKSYNDLGYLLRPEELWARTFSQYIAKKTSSAALVQQISAENKIRTDGIMYAPYWPDNQFQSVESAMNAIFRDQGWLE